MHAEIRSSLIAAIRASVYRVAAPVGRSQSIGLGIDVFSCFFFFRCCFSPSLLLFVFWAGRATPPRVALVS